MQSSKPIECSVVKILIAIYIQHTYACLASMCSVLLNSSQIILSQFTLAPLTDILYLSISHSVLSCLSFVYALLFPSITDVSPDTTSQRKHFFNINFSLLSHTTCFVLKYASIYLKMLAEGQNIDISLFYFVTCITKYCALLPLLCCFDNSGST